MKNKKFAFAGNRAFVLQRMFDLGLDICEIWAVQGSYLEKYLIKMNLSYNPIITKERLCNEILAANFDYFISNGLPIILPISKIKKSHQEFINIHPSLLPTLRGMDPIPGAILFGENSGATCHYMDDGIDTGSIISQVPIPMTSDLDSGLLYQLSFLAEADAFSLAYKRNFKSSPKKMNANRSYYSFKNDDLWIDLTSDSIEQIFAKTNAFSTQNKGSRFTIDNDTYIVNDVIIINNPYVTKAYANIKNGSIALRYENRLIVKSHNCLLKFTLKQIIGSRNDEMD